MTSSLPGHRELPVSQYDLSTYWGRVRHAANISDPRCAPSGRGQLPTNPAISRIDANADRMMLVSPSTLDSAKGLITSYKQNGIPNMTPELWRAKKVVDSTLHPGLFLPASAWDSIGVYVWNGSD